MLLSIAAVIAAVKSDGTFAGWGAPSATMNVDGRVGSGSDGDPVSSCYQPAILTARPNLTTS